MTFLIKNPHQFGGGFLFEEKLGNWSPGDNFIWKKVYDTYYGGQNPDKIGDQGSVKGSVYDTYYGGQNPDKISSRTTRLFF
jgi:hypothetical protein